MINYGRDLLKMAVGNLHGFPENAKPINRTPRGEEVVEYKGTKILIRNNYLLPDY